MPSKLPVISEKNRNTVTDLSFGDNHLDGASLHGEIEKLRGQKLAPEILVQLVRDFAARMPPGISGLQIRAIRAPSGGVAVKVWAEHGSTDPAKRYAWSTMVVSQSGKNLLADTDVPKPGAASQSEAWKEFTRALTKALGGSPESEIVARIGLMHSNKD